MEKQVDLIVQKAKECGFLQALAQLAVVLRDNKRETDILETMWQYYHKEYTRV